MKSIIKSRFIPLAIMAFSTLLSSAPAQADALTVRCAADTLNPARARQRLEWARACGTRINLVSPTAPRAPAFAYQVGLTSLNGIALWEYIETDDFWGRNSYSGDLAAVNQSFTEHQWRIGGYTASNDALGFQKWTEASTLFLARPTYPTFSNNVDINSGAPLYPNPNYALNDCNLYTDRAATHVANTSVTGFFVNAFCSANDIACGNGVCGSGESSSTCPQDCAPCGDGFCSFGETASSCPSDCGSVCGDGLCGGSETAFSCPTDCGFCGDGLCTLNESSLSCPTDCGGGGTCGCGGGGPILNANASSVDGSIIFCPDVICPI